MDELLDDYRRHAAEHGQHTVEGNADAANAAHDRLQRTFVAIMSAGKGTELFLLYDETNCWVQLWAAAHTLELNESKALAMLSALQQAGIPGISTTAKYTIQEWKGGKLKFLPSTPATSRGAAPWSGRPGKPI